MPHLITKMSCSGQCCRRHPRRCDTPPKDPAATSAVATVVDLPTHIGAAWKTPHDWKPLIAHRTRARAGLLYLQIGRDWPPWTAFIIRAAAANAPTIDFYFLGAPLPSSMLAACANCISLPLDEDALLGRVALHLGLARGSVVLDNRGRKVGACFDRTSLPIVSVIEYCSRCVRAALCAHSSVT